MQKDNSTFIDKLKIRRKALSWLDAPPVILETHGGSGRLYKQLYSEFEGGVVFEKDQAKAEYLSRQRTTWAVYQSDTVSGLAAGAASWKPFNFIDCDPYGEPWHVISAFIAGRREFEPRLVIVVNDGLRQKIQLGGAWMVRSLEEAVKKFGNDLYGNYLEIARWLMQSKVAPAGYTVSHFEGKYAGHNEGMTHYAAILSRKGATS